MKLSVTDLDFAYNHAAVLTGVSFTLEPGEIMCVMGVNGAGKSTLLKCLNRILKPRGGSVMVGGEDLLSMKRNNIAKLIGYVPQRHPETLLTVFEAVLMGRKPYVQWSMNDRDYEIAEEVIHRIGIAHLAMRPVNGLSGGEIQKVVIARALAQSPEILLLDEPTSNLDLKNQLDVMGLIRQIVETQDISAIIAIHDLNIAVRFAERFIFLRDHFIQAVATRETLTADMIQRVYDINVLLERVGGHTVVVPV